MTDMTKDDVRESAALQAMEFMATSPGYIQGDTLLDSMSISDRSAFIQGWVQCALACFEYQFGE